MIKTVFTFIMCLNLIRSQNKSRMESFVISGTFSRIKDFPHSVYLDFFCGKRKTFCGASILNQQILISAAHCFNNDKICREDKLIIAKFGDEKHNRGTKEEISQYKMHEHFSEDHFECDIALGLLKNPITLNSNVGRVALSKQFVRSGQIATVAGWGYIDDYSTETEQLMHVTQQVLSRSQCLKILGNLPVGVFCANYKDQTVASGDSGSALVVDRFIQVGVVSYGMPTHRFIIVYSDIAYFYNWIQRNSAMLYCKRN